MNSGSAAVSNGIILYKSGLSYAIKRAMQTGFYALNYEILSRFLCPNQCTFCAHFFREKSKLNFSVIF